jgi:hypothetical protein
MIPIKQHDSFSNDNEYNLVKQRYLTNPSLHPLSTIFPNLCAWVVWEIQVQRLNHFDKTLETLKWHAFADSTSCDNIIVGCDDTIVGCDERWTWLKKTCKEGHVELIEMTTL